MYAAPPAFDSQLFVVDVAWGRIFRISAAGEGELLLEYDGEPHGLKVDADGRLFIAEYRHGIMVVDPRTRDIKPYRADVAVPTRTMYSHA